MQLQTFLQRYQCICIHICNSTSHHRAWSCHWAHCRGWSNRRACPGSWSDHRAVPLGTVHLPWGEFFSFSHHSSWNSYRSCNRSDHRAHCEGRSDSGVCHKARSNLVGPIARIGAAAGSVPGVGEAAALSADPALFPLRMLKSAEHSSVGVGQALAHCSD